MTTSRMRRAMAGFGNVGRAVAEGLESAAADTGCAFSMVGVSDPRYGVVVDATGDGLDVSTLVAAAEADALVELSYTDLQSGEPARSHIQAALGRGIHVSPTNKGPVGASQAAAEAIADAEQHKVADAVYYDDVIKTFERAAAAV